MHKNTEILIADDHDVVREGLRQLLEERLDCRVVAEAPTGEEAVAKAREHQPQVAILDIRMPGISGVEACRQIVETVPDCQVIMLTAYAEDELLYNAVEAGASGYVLKRAGSAELVQLVERVARGERLDPAAALKQFKEKRRQDQARWEKAFRDLTPRELKVLALMTQGMTNRQIADELYLGHGTIRNHVSRILAKLDVSNRAQAAIFAEQHHIDEMVRSDGTMDGP